MLKGCLYWVLGIFLLYSAITVGDWLASGGLAMLGMTALGLVVSIVAIVFLIHIVLALDQWRRDIVRERLAQLASRSADDAANYRRFLEAEATREQAAKDRAQQAAKAKRKARASPSGTPEAAIENGLEAIAPCCHVTLLAGRQAFVGLLDSGDGVALGRLNGEGTLADVSVVRTPNIISVTEARDSENPQHAASVSYGDNNPALLLTVRDLAVPRRLLVFESPAICAVWLGRIREVTGGGGPA